MQFSAELVGLRIAHSRIATSLSLSLSLFMVDYKEDEP
jgi:hypothetical protein